MALEDFCIEYKGVLNDAGYGPHRRIYEKARGSIPRGYEIDHLCRNRACINLDHLEAVTKDVNYDRAMDAHTTCKRGHYNKWSWETNGRRKCYKCQRINQAKANAKRRGSLQN